MDLVIDLAVTTVCVFVVLQYGRALKTHFASPKMPTGTVVISIVVSLTTLIFLGLLWIESQPLLAQAVGLAICLASMWLFYAAIRASREARLKMAFDVENPHGLVTTGPYRYLRHPFYTSYLIFWVGFAVATWSAWTLLPLAIILFIYVRAALGEEAKFSRTPMAEEYAAYRQRTGFFWPKFS